MSGLGQRFINAGYKDPKPLIKVDGKPIIQHVFELFDSPDDVIFICNELHLFQTEMYDILKGIAPNCTIISVPNEGRKGPVHTILHVKEQLPNRPIIVSYCDYGTVWDYDAFLKECQTSDGVIACYTGFHPHMLGSDNYAFCRTKDGNIVEVQEKKPFTSNKMAELASNGTYYFCSKAMMVTCFEQLVDSNESINGEFYVSMAYNFMIREGKKVTPFLIEKMLQWGTPYDLEVYQSWSKYFSNRNQPLPNNPPNTLLVLPMAGEGKRFKDEGYETPKPLLPIDNKSMVVQAVKCLPKTSEKVFICLLEHHEKFEIEKELLKEFDHTSILWVEEKTDGQACTCEIGVLGILYPEDSPIFISACDNAATYDSNKYQNLVDDVSVDVIVWSFRNNPTSKNKPDMYSWLSVDSEDNITGVSVKKCNGDPTKSYAIIGTFFFRKSKYFLDTLDINYATDTRTNGEFYVDDVINRCIENGLCVKVFEVDNYICWGTPNDYRVYQYWEEHFNA
jgi:NDP-sugar pyrophosphorylase family protein